MADTTLILIRHGETPWNAVGRLQGAIDIALSERGQWQAQRVADRLRREPLAAVISSDLARAAQTAAPLAAAHGLALQLEPGLRERSYGIFEGETYEVLAARFPTEWARHQSRDVDWVVPGGESIAQLRDRVLAALSVIAVRHAGEQVAVVAHGGVLDAIYRVATGFSWTAPRQHALPNAGIHRLRLSAQPFSLAVLEWGDVAHLEQSRDELSVV
ncbi:MAG: histidine phosphatase family protein [Burkholderiaceae bacterium]